MADNVAITAGVGTSIASDDVGGVQYQKVKLDAGGDGVAIPVVAGQQTMAASVPVVPPSNLTDATYVGDIKFGEALPAGEAVIGLLGRSDIVVTVTPTVDTNIYAASDLLFDSAEVANAVRSNGYCCKLVSLVIIDKADQGVVFTLLFANAATDFGTVNDAPNPDDAECATVIGVVAVAAADFVDLGGAKVACLKEKDLGILLKAGAATTSLYIAGVNGASTPTYGAATDLVFYLGFERN